MDNLPNRIFSVPYNNDPTFVDSLLKSNFSTHISEVYGADNKFVGGRYLGRQYLTIKDDVKKLLQNNIAFNYTLNSISFIGYAINYDDLFRHIEYLHNIGVKVLTISHPIMLQQLIKKGFDFIFDSSVNQFISSTPRIEQIIEFGYNRIAIDEDFTRDLNFIKQVRKKATLPIKVIVNSCCINGCVNRITHQNLLSSKSRHLSEINRRKIIYDLKSYCKSSVNSSMQLFMNSNWIRPEDIPMYHSLGVSFFKISGRTYSTEAIVKMFEFYAELKYDGLIKEYLKPGSGYLQDKKFNYLLNKDVEHYFLHKWKCCLDNRCPECVNIINSINDLLKTRMK